MWRPILYGTRAASACVHRVPAAAHSLQPVVVLRRCNSNIKMTKQLKKMFDRRSGPKKKKIFPGPVNLGINSSENVDKYINIRKKPQYTEGQKRRAHQVGRVLYDNIVHLINSGELSTELAELSVEIVKVKVIPDFSAVNVYWLSSGSKEDDTVQTLLSENAGQLRQLLTSLHVLGSIPHICFVRDNSQARYMEVQSLLASADFGPDFVPSRLDSSIREIRHDTTQDDLSSEDTLQEDFNALNIKAMSTTVQSSPGRFTVHEASGTEEQRAFVQFVANEKTKDSSFGAKAYTSQSSDGMMNTLNTESKSLEVDDKEKQFGLKTSCSSPSSLDVEQLSIQYLSEFNQSADSSKEEESESLSRAFRDDLYKVPHTELLNKILIKKQRAGIRPTLNVHTEASERAPKVESTCLKPLFQKKQKLKGRLKMQSDYYGNDFVEVNHGNDYTDDDFGVLDEEMDDSEVASTEIYPRGSDKK